MDAMDTVAAVSAPARVSTRMSRRFECNESGIFKVFSLVAKKLFTSTALDAKRCHPEGIRPGCPKNLGFQPGVPSGLECQALAAEILRRSSSDRLRMTALF